MVEPQNDHAVCHGLVSCCVHLAEERHLIGAGQQLGVDMRDIPLFSLALNEQRFIGHQHFQDIRSGQFSCRKLTADIYSGIFKVLRVESGSELVQSECRNACLRKYHRLYQVGYNGLAALGGSYEKVELPRDHNGRNTYSDNLQQKIQLVRIGTGVERSFNELLERQSLLHLCFAVIAEIQLIRETAVQRQLFSLLIGAELSVPDVNDPVVRVYIEL